MSRRKQEDDDIISRSIEGGQKFKPRRVRAHGFLSRLIFNMTADMNPYTETRLVQKEYEDQRKRAAFTIWNQGWRAADLILRELDPQYEEALRNFLPISWNIQRAGYRKTIIESIAKGNEPPLGTPVHAVTSCFINVRIQNGIIEDKYLRKILANINEFKHSETNNEHSITYLINYIRVLTETALAKGEKDE